MNPVEMTGSGGGEEEGLGWKMDQALAGSQSGHPQGKVAAPPPEWTGMWPVFVNCPE